VTLTVLSKQRAKIVTDFGTITLDFYYDEAPNHVRNFVELARQGFYDSLTFHRIIPGGIIQGGDPKGDGRGIRPDGKTLKAEFSKIPFDLGTVGMARSPHNPDSASCQFFICLGRQHSFDGTQTAFAKVVGDESFETLKKIAATPTGPKDRPLQPVYIRTVSLENIPDRPRDSSSPGAAGDKTPPLATVVKLIAPDRPESRPVDPPGPSKGHESTTRPAGAAK
jgi:peptidyl-prolyl cis-trans isomerase B (cyclophilin B)